MTGYQNQAVTQSEPSREMPRDDAGDEDEILSRAERFYRDAMSAQSNWRKEAREDFSFVAGKQWSDEDKSKLAQALRPVITFNRVQPVIDSVGGAEVQNRQEVRYIPRKIGDAGVNEVLSNAAKWMRDECDAEDEESDAFLDTTICGMGWCLSGDAMVRTPDSHFVTTRLYSGLVVHINLENGQELTGTPNHPVLTDRGWKRLCDLEEGDNLIRSAFLERVQGLPVEQFDKVETRLEDKVNAFRAGRKALRLVTAPDDFNADGVGSKVHVVYADGALRDQIRHAALIQKLKKTLFGRWHLLAVRGVALLRDCLLSGTVLPPVCQPAFGGIHAPSSHVAGDDVVPQLVSGLAKTLRDGFGMQADLGPNLDRRKEFIEVEPRQFLDAGFGDRAAVVLPQGVASPEQPGFNGGVRYSNLIRDFRDWKPDLEVQARKLFGGNVGLAELYTRVERRVIRSVSEFPVHDVGTSLGFFIAGDIITSNTETRLDYEADPEGKVFIERVDPLEMVWDPRATKRNLTDARMVMRIRIMAREDVEALWPDKADELTSDVGPWTSEFGNQEDDNEIHDATDAPWYRNNQSDGDSHTDELVVVHFQWFERETAWRVADPSTGEIKTLDDKKYQRVSSRMVKLGMKFKAVKQTKKVYKQAFICGKTILASGDALCPDHFTFRAITGKRDHNAQTWYGLVRAMKDPQRWANKWLSQGMHIFNSNAKGGLIAERGAFENPEKAEDEWADPTSITFLNPGGLGKIQPKEPVQFPQGITDLLTFGVSSIRDVTGVNLEMLGLAEQDQAGVVEWHRKKSALTVLANFFDSLRRYRKEQGRVMLYIIQHYLSDGRLVRIEGPEATQYIPLMHDPNISTYDVVVDDAPSSPNQKEMVWGVLQQMLPSLLQLGMPVPPDVLDYSPLPTGLAQKWKQMILQQQQQPNPQQALAQSQLAIAQAQVESAKARAQGDQAKAQAGMAQAQATGQQAQADMAHAQVSAAHVGIEQQAQAADIELKRANAAAAIAKARATLASIPMDQLEQIIRSLDTLHGVSIDERGHGLDVAQAQHDAAMDRHGAAMDQRQQQHAEQAHSDQDAVAQRQADIAEQAAKQRPAPAR